MFRLENPSRVIKSNHYSSTVRFTPCIAPCLNNSRNGNYCLSGQLCQCLTGLSMNIQPEPTLAHLEAVSCHPVPVPWEQSPASLAVPSCQGVMQSQKIPPKPPFHQAEPPQLLPIGFVLHVLLPLLFLQDIWVSHQAQDDSMHWSGEGACEKTDHGLLGLLKIWARQEDRMVVGSFWNH